MESSGGRPTPDEAATALLDAGTARDDLSHRLMLPSWFYTSIGMAIAVQTATLAVGVAAQSKGGIGLAVAGLLPCLLVAVVQLGRFRKLNGARVGGLASRVVLGFDPAVSTAHFLGMGAALWAASAGRWWLVGVCAIAGGVGYALGGLRWMRAYRGNPAAHSRGESALLLAALAVPLIAGAVLLVAGAR